MVQPWYASFVDIPDEALDDLIWAADILDVPPLSDLLKATKTFSIYSTGNPRVNKLPPYVRIELLTEWITLNNVYIMYTSVPIFNWGTYLLVFLSRPLNWQPLCVAVSIWICCDISVMASESPLLLCAIVLAVIIQASLLDVAAIITTCKHAYIRYFILPKWDELLKSPEICFDTTNGVINNNFLNWIIAKGIRVSELDLFAVESPECITAITESAPENRMRIKSVSLMGQKHISSSDLCGLLSACPSLTSCCLEDCNNVTDEVIRALAGACPALTNLDLSVCSSIIDDGLFCIARCSQVLTTLNLSFCSRLTDAAVLAIVRSCSHLTSFDISDCLNVTDTVLKALLECNRRLSHFAFSDCQHITEPAIVQLTRANPHLLSLGLDCIQISDIAFSELAENCKSLTSLSAYSCTGITCGAIDSLSSNCKSLAILSIGGSFVTDEVISILSEKCITMTSLDLSDGDLITDVAVRSIAAHNSALTKLKLCRCSNITDEAVLAISSACKALTYLDLSECVNITDNAVEAIAASCNELGTLFLRKCSITDKSLVSLANGCPHLYVLFLEGCTQLTEPAKARLYFARHTVGVYYR